jgi:hypothetical protein
VIFLSLVSCVLYVCVQYIFMIIEHRSQKSSFVTGSCGITQFLCCLKGSVDVLGMLKTLHAIIVLVGS